MSFDDELRDSLRAHAPDPSHVRAPVWEPPQRVPLRSRPWWAPALAVASVAVFAVGAGVAASVLSSSGSTPLLPTPLSTMTIAPSPTTSPTTSATSSNSPTRTESDRPKPENTEATPSTTTPPSTEESTPRDTRPARPPKYYKAFRYRGVELFAHESYEKNAWTCGDQYESTVIVGPLPTGCDYTKGSISDAGLIRMEPAETADGQEFRRGLTRKVDIYGATAYVNCKRCTGTNLIGADAIYFPDQQVVIKVVSATMIGDMIDEANLEILETVRVIRG